MTGRPESVRSSQRLCSKAAASTVVNGEYSFILRASSSPSSASACMACKIRAQFLHECDVSAVFQPQAQAGHRGFQIMRDRREDLRALGHESSYPILHGVEGTQGALHFDRAADVQRRLVDIEPKGFDGAGHALQRPHGEKQHDPGNPSHDGQFEDIAGPQNIPRRALGPPPRLSDIGQGQDLAIGKAGLNAITHGTARRFLALGRPVDPGALDGRHPQPLGQARGKAGCGCSRFLRFRAGGLKAPVVTG